MGKSQGVFFVALSPASLKALSAGLILVARYLAARTAYAQYRNKGMDGTVGVVPAPTESPAPKPTPEKKG